MGCCESRSGKEFESQSTSSNPNMIPRDQSRIANESLSFSLPTFENITDSKTLDILSYISDLDRDNLWHQVHQEPDIMVFKLESSKYNSENMVTKVQIDIGIVVPIQVILQYLTSLDLRKSWDFFIEGIEIIDGDDRNGILHRKVKLLFYRAEFVERQIVVVQNNQVCVVTYSLGSDEYKDRCDKPRDINIMTAFIISDNEKGSEITLVNQMGYTNYIKNLPSSISINQQKQWMHKLKRKIKAHLEKPPHR